MGGGGGGGGGRAGGSALPKFLGQMQNDVGHHHINQYLGSVIVLYVQCHVVHFYFVSQRRHYRMTLLEETVSLILQMN